MRPARHNMAIHLHQTGIGCLLSDDSGQLSSVSWPIRQRVCIMHCIACGNDMRLVETMRDDSMMVPGYVRQTLQCAHCHDIEHRLVFTGETQAPPSESAPAAEAAGRAFTSATAAVSDAELELDEGAALLQRAIAMVRSPTRSSNAGGLAAREPSAAAGPTGSLPVRRPPRRVVQIRHDPNYDAQYAAADATSGIVVLRHRDRARLWAMCNRLGWQVDDGSRSRREMMSR